MAPFAPKLRYKASLMPSIIYVLCLVLDQNLLDQKTQLIFQALLSRNKIYPS